MAALLTGEKDNSDKIARYINECKHMKLKILPPDSNESFAQFTVVGDNAIRFGLSAVKNVGGGAVESIIEVRKRGGRFRSFFEFCDRINARAMNKKVIESLIKCGAFDSFRAKRSSLMAGAEKIMALAGAMQKDRQSGQLLLFDAVPQNKTTEMMLPDIEEWPLHQLLTFEKEMLGFYITAHPLDQYKKIMRRYSILHVSDLYDTKINANEEVVVAGTLEKIKTTITKRKGEKMAIIRMEDTEMFIEVLVFPETYKQSFMYLQQDAVVVVKGKLDLKEDTPKIIAAMVIPIEQAPRVLIDSISLTISDLDLQQNVFVQLKEIILSHPGRTPVHLAMCGQQGKKVKIKADAGVEVNTVLISDLEKILGKDDVLINLKK
jgi:DNA polymerase-3 subunit alpha